MATDTAAPPAAAPAAPEADDQPRGWDWLDTAGLIAGVVLIVILADIFTDGRVISRHLPGRQAPAPDPEVPGE